MPIPLCCSLFRNSRDFGLHSPLSSIIMRIERPWLVWLRAYFPLDPESRMQSAVKTYSAERSITCTTIYGIVQQKRKKRGRFLIKKFITGNSKTVHSSKYHIRPSKVPNVSPKSFEAPLGGGLITHIFHPPPIYESTQQACTALVASSGGSTSPSASNSANWSSSAAKEGLAFGSARQASPSKAARRLS